MLDLILGNAVSLVGCIIDAVSVSQKTHKRMLLVQSGGQVLFGISSFILKGYSSTVQNAVSLLRNFVAIRNVKSKALEWFFVAAGVVLGLVFNNRGLLGLLPVVANFEYSLAVFRFKDNPIAMKIAFCVSVLLYIIFNACILNFVGAIFKVFLFITGILFLVKAIWKKDAGE